MYIYICILDALRGASRAPGWTTSATSAGSAGYAILYCTTLCCDMVVYELILYT